MHPEIRTNVRQTSDTSIIRGTARAFECCKPAEMCCFERRSHSTRGSCEKDRARTQSAERGQTPLPHHVGVEGCLWFLTDSAKSGDSSALTSDASHRTHW